MHKVVLYPGEDKSWVAKCPAYPELVSKGRTKLEARANLRNAISKFEKCLEKIEADPKFIEMMERSAADIKAGRVFSQEEVERYVASKRKRK